MIKEPSHSVALSVEIIRALDAMKWYPTSPELAAYLAETYERLWDTDALRQFMHESELFGMVNYGCNTPEDDRERRWQLTTEGSGVHGRIRFLMRTATPAQKENHETD